MDVSKKVFATATLDARFLFALLESVLGDNGRMWRITFSARGGEKGGEREKERKKGDSWSGPLARHETLGWPSTYVIVLVIPST